MNTCLTPILTATQGICSELNSRNPAILPLRHHQKPCISPYKVQYLGLTTAKSPSRGHVPLGTYPLPDRLAGDTYRQAPSASELQIH